MSTEPGSGSGANGYSAPELDHRAALPAVRRAQPASRGALAGQVRPTSGMRLMGLHSLSAQGYLGGSQTAPAPPGPLHPHMPSPAPFSPSPLKPAASPGRRVMIQA